MQGVCHADRSSIVAETMDGTTSHLLTVVEESLESRAGGDRRGTVYMYVWA